MESGIKVKTDDYGVNKDCDILLTKTFPLVYTIVRGVDSALHTYANISKPL